MRPGSSTSTGRSSHTVHSQMIRLNSDGTADHVEHPGDYPYTNPYFLFTYNQEGVHDVKKCV